MAETRKASSAKRFGVRYGRSMRQKISDLERDIHTKQKCPYCAKNKVKRVAVGIWHCRGCDTKFTGAAYSIKREVKSAAEGSR